MSKKQVTKEQKQTIKRVSKVLLGIARGSAQTSPEIAYAGFMGCLHILKTAGVINGFKELTLRTQDNGNRKVNFRILYPWNSGKGKNNPTGKKISGKYNRVNLEVNSTPFQLL